MRKYLFAAVLFLGISCQKLLEIPIPNFENKMVVNCIITKDTTINIRLSTTSRINANETQFIDNALVLLKQENNVVDTLKNSGNGYYYSTIKAQKCVTYKLEIQHSQFGLVYATTSIPNSLNISNISQKDFAVPLENNEFNGDVRLPACLFSFNINDPANEQNYYEIILTTKQTWNDSMSINPERLVYPFSYMSEIVNEDILDYSPQKIIFSDSLFNGQTKKIDILYVPMWLGMYGMQEYTYGKYRLIYKIRSISKEMYLYNKWLIKHQYNQQSDDITKFADPVQMWTNINNGYGVFAGYLETKDSIFVKETLFVF